ncbi:unnamed protein product, partial [marine sediment metagenome]
AGEIWVQLKRLRDQFELLFTRIQEIDHKLSLIHGNFWEDVI